MKAEWKGKIHQLGQQSFKANVILGYSGIPVLELKIEIHKPRWKSTVTNGINQEIDKWRDGIQTE